MTSAISQTDFPHPRRGFSLTEILVVIGIIVILVSILVPTVLKAYSNSVKTRFAFNLQAVSMALEAYKQAFGDYPRNLNGTTGVGPAVLCKALVGPGGTTDNSPAFAGATTADAGDCVTNGGATFVAVQKAPTAYTPGTAGSDDYWAPWSPVDGAAGDGWRTRVGSGSLQGPFLNLTLFKINGQFLMNKNGTPILYYPANPVKSNITTGTNYVGAAATSLYKGNDCIYGNNYGVNAAESTNNLRALLGNYSLTGAINSTYGVEQAIGTYPYLLIASGPDDGFGPLTDLVSAGMSPANWAKNRGYMAACDDVTNFPR